MNDEIPMTNDETRNGYHAESVIRASTLVRHSTIELHHSFHS